MRRSPHTDHGPFLSLLILAPIVPVAYLFVRFLVPDPFLGALFGAAVTVAVVTIYYIGRGRI